MSLPSKYFWPRDETVKASIINITSGGSPLCPLPLSRVVAYSAATGGGGESTHSWPVEWAPYTSREFELPPVSFPRAKPPLCLFTEAWNRYVPRGACFLAHRRWGFSGIGRTCRARGPFWAREKSTFVTGIDSVRRRVFPHE